MGVRKQFKCCVLTLMITKTILIGSEQTAREVSGNGCSLFIPWATRKDWLKQPVFFSINVYLM